MKLVLFAVFASVVTAWPGMVPLYRRTNSEFAAVFKELGEPLASELAAKVAALGIHPAAAITTVDPGKTWAAVEAIVTTLMEEAVPAKCAEALAIHAITGFARHVVFKVLTKDWIHTLEECGTEAGITGLGAWAAAPAVGAAKVPYAALASPAAGAFPAVAAGYPAAGSSIVAAAMLPNAMEMKKIVAAFMGAIDAMLWPVTSTLGDAHLEAVFMDLEAFMHAALAMNKPAGEVIQAVAMMAHKHLAAFGTTINCDVAGKMDSVDAALNSVLEYLGGGFVATMHTIALPDAIKTKLVKRLTVTMGTVAATISKLVKADKGDIVAFILTVFKHGAAKFHKDIAIVHIVDQVMADGKMVAFVEGLIKEGKAKEAFKMLITTTAITFGDLDLPPELIKAFLTSILKTFAVDKIPTAQGFSMH